MKAHRQAGSLSAPVALLLLGAIVLDLAGCRASDRPPPGDPTSADVAEAPPSEDPPEEAEEPAGELPAQAPPLADCSPRTVWFDFDQSIIRADARSTLEAVVECLRSLGEGATVLVVCHTALPGTEEYNFALSGRYGMSVRRFLTEAGVPATSIRVENRGEDSPLCEGGTEECNARNRRCELTASPPGS